MPSTHLELAGLAGFNPLRFGLEGCEFVLRVKYHEVRANKKRAGLSMTYVRGLLSAALVLASSASMHAADSQTSSAQTRLKPRAVTQDTVETLAQDAASDFARKDYISAAEKYERLSRLQPKSANVLNNLGISYHLSGRIRDAMPVLRKALGLNPNLLSANLFLGIGYVQLNQPEQAIAPLEKVLSLDRTNRDALLTLASAHYALKRFDLAAKAYLRETTLQPQDADAWFGLGFCFEQIGHNVTGVMQKIGQDSPYTQMLTGEFMMEQNAIVDSEEAFRRALASGGEREGVRAALGFAQLRLGEFSQAEQEFKREVESYPGSQDGKLGLAAVAMERNDFGAAAQWLCEIYTTDEGYFHARLDFFLASLRDQTQSKAVEGLQADLSRAKCIAAVRLVKDQITSPESAIGSNQAFEPLSPGSPFDPSEIRAADAAHQAGRYSDCANQLRATPPATTDDGLLLARCACLSGQFYAAFEASQSILAKEPQNMAAHFWQVESSRKLAQAGFQRAINLKPDSWQGHLLLGDIYRQRKKWDVAMSHYEAVTRLKPDNPGALLGIATIHWQTGNNPLGETTLKKALEIVPDNPTANFILGDIYVRMRRFEEAIPYLQRHLALGGGLLTAHGDLGKAYLALKRDKEAISELLLALPTDRSGELHYQLSVLYKRQGEAELAKQALAKSEELRAHERATQRERLERSLGGEENSPPPQP